MDLREYADHFLNYLATNNYSKSTIKSYNYAFTIFKNYMITYNKVYEYEDLNDKLIKGFMLFVMRKKSRISKKRLKKHTVFNIFSCIKMYFDHIASSEDMDNEYSHLLKVKRVAEQLPKNVLSESQINEILKLPNEVTYIGFRDKVLLELLYNTGLRRSEVVNLEVYDLNFEEHTVFVRQGKGRKDRIVPMGEYLEKYLQEYINAVRPALHRNAMFETALFLTICGKAFKKSGLDQLIREYRKRTSIPFTCHTFRHSFATHLLKHGASVLYIQRLLGHENVSTTQIYTKLYPADLRRELLKYHPRSNTETANEKIIVPERHHILRIHEAKKRLDQKKS